MFAISDRPPPRTWRGRGLALHWSQPWTPNSRLGPGSDHCAGHFLGGRMYVTWRRTSPYMRRTVVCLDEPAGDTGVVFVVAGCLPVLLRGLVDGTWSPRTLL